MRIISGKHRSRVIKMVDIDTTRETTDKVRGAIFNLISFYPIKGACLDLFSGSGAMGLEALSRGCSKAYFNDLGKKGIVYINYVSDGIYVYNNTIVTGKETENIIQSNDKRTSFFYNNLIYNRSSKANFSFTDTSGLVAEYNLVYNEEGASIKNSDFFKKVNANGVYENPIFQGFLQEDSELGIDNLFTFQLEYNSPALNVGKEVDAKEDFFGNPYKKSIGFYCGG